MKNWKPSYYFLITAIVIIVDQIVKYLVHQNMYVGENKALIGDVVNLNYQLNPGMAWGQKIDNEYGKLILTSFRLVVSFVIPWYILKLYKNGSHRGLILCIALIFGGAVGNLIDGLIYGVLDPDLMVSGALFPAMHGYVIDMFYFSLFHGEVPLLGWVDLWPVFNVADASIFCSVIAIMIFNKKFFPEKENKEVKGLE